MISLKQALVTIVGLTGLLSFSACSTTPTGLTGKFAPITPQQVQTVQSRSDTVRWGGLIVDTLPEKNQTCFRIMGIRLNNNGEPMAANQANFEGRFLACAKDFYDPQLYTRGRRITFIGAIDGLKHEKIGHYDYPYPLIKASVVYLWPRERVHPQANAYYMNGWWGPYGGWGWWPWMGEAPPPYFRDPDSHHHHHPHSHTKPPLPPIRPHMPAGRPLSKSPLQHDRKPIHRPPPESTRGVILGLDRHRP